MTESTYSLTSKDGSTTTEWAIQDGDWIKGHRGITIYAPMPPEGDEVTVRAARGSAGDRQGSALVDLARRLEHATSVATYESNKVVFLAAATSLDSDEIAALHTKNAMENR